MTISNYKAINRNTLIAAFDLALPSGITIFGVKLHEKTTGERWISFPDRPFTKGDGSTGYGKIIDIPDRATKNKFDDAVIEALTDAGHINADAR